ncbi:Phospholipase D1 [Ceratocystis lukuohia]|uniref:Phospholipase n=1 Tax=Ceratocystis lukuohia TaxID=2019550 RepID=A0ABR4MN19_9PEZI
MASEPDNPTASKSRFSMSSFKGVLQGAAQKIQENSSLQDAKVSLIHSKNKIGKFGNIFNRNHRHDEEHEKACDAKRTAICEQNRFKSFFPERDNNNIKWYVDGRNYFWAVSEALENATETIYIADWWLSPELFLRRPPLDNAQWRLDQVLKRKAEQGVKIYVSVYREVEAALTCNSKHTKEALRALCPEGSPGYGNISVMRHPDHNVFENAADMTLYWAHHEKFIVIDYKMAFIGGLDLCFGRWDNNQHPLSDIHADATSKEVWPGQDFNNNRIMDFKSVDDWMQNEISKDQYGRMPWHDVSMGLIGPCVYDIAEHFVLRWNFVKRDKYKRDDRFDWLELRGRQGENEDLVAVQRPSHPVGEYIMHPITPIDTAAPAQNGTIRAQVVRSSDDWSMGILTDHSIQNAYSEIIQKAEHYVYIENQFFITATGNQQSPIHNTVGRAMVDAVLRAAEEKRKFRIIIVIPAVPGFAGDLRDDSAAGTRAIMDYQFKSICRGEHSIFEQIKAKSVDPKEYIFFFNLRSYDRLPRTKRLRDAEKVSGVKYSDVQRGAAEEVMADSLHPKENNWHGKKYYESLKEHNPASSRRGSNEEMAEALAFKRRFEEALAQTHVKDQPTTKPTLAHLTMYDQESVLDQFWPDDPKDEVQNWIQEELYIHSKLLIADDRIVICGSSNLNDRSQLGSHDSELSIVMEDTRPLQTTMDGKQYIAGWHAATLRRYLWREHLGLLRPQPHDASKDPNAQPPGPQSPNDPIEDETMQIVADPLNDDLWKMWTEQATQNTEMFRHLFHADPDNYVKTFEDYDLFRPPRAVKPGHIFDPFLPPDDIRRKLDTIKGHFVWMPLEFLKDAEMAERGLQLNQFTESVYT